MPLLYLSASSEVVHAARKAFAALAQTASSNARISADQLAWAMYPHGTAAGEAIFKTPYSISEVKAVAGQAGKAAPGSEPTVSADQLVYNVYGARLMAACGSRLVLRDLFLDMWRVKPADAS